MFELRPRYQVHKEPLGGVEHWMIYRHWLWCRVFVERWNTEASANVRLAELSARDGAA